jgi:undecaprenyl-diphosphatase
MQVIYRLADLDGRILEWVALRRGRMLTTLMRGVSRTGDAVSVVAALVVALALRPGRTSVLVTASVLLALAMFSLAKRLIRRTRPLLHAVIAAPDRFSMPSGHATTAWAIAVSVAVIMPALLPLAFAWALAISFSRVVLGVHYPFDVAVGATLGTVSALVVLLSMR